MEQNIKSSRKLKVFINIIKKIIVIETNFSIYKGANYNVLNGKKLRVYFYQNPSPDSRRLKEIASLTNIDEKYVRTWFSKTRHQVKKNEAKNLI